jgi:hypothetical protein
MEWSPIVVIGIGVCVFIILGAVAYISTKEKTFRKRQREWEEFMRTKEKEE